MARAGYVTADAEVASNAIHAPVACPTGLNGKPTVNETCHVGCCQTRHRDSESCRD
jgi:hypothetical protein